MSEAAALHRARRRREQHLTLLEGPHLMAEALAAGVSLERVFVTPGDVEAAGRARRSNAEVVVVTDEVLARLSSTETPQSPVAVVRVPDEEVPAGGNLLVAWGVSDPGNVGTLIRTAAAFGWGFGAGPGTADPWSPKVLRAGAGSHFRSTVCRVGRLADLGARSLVAAVPAGGVMPEAMRDVGTMALLVGDEGAGLPDEVVGAADLRVTIPMPGGTESLNAAVAGSILVYEASVGGGGPVTNLPRR